MLCDLLTVWTIILSQKNNTLHTSASNTVANRVSVCNPVNKPPRPLQNVMFFMFLSTCIVHKVCVCTMNFVSAGKAHCCYCYYWVSDSTRLKPRWETMLWGWLDSSYVSCRMTLLNSSHNQWLESESFLRNLKTSDWQTQLFCTQRNELLCFSDAWLILINKDNF